jgi:hypothetical protein
MGSEHDREWYIRIRKEEVIEGKTQITAWRG